MSPRKPQKKLRPERKKNGGKKPSPQPPEEARGEFPIAGIGASAGGLEAFISLLKNLPSDTGIAYIYIQHLAPKHESMLTDILARETQMPVLMAKENMAVQPDNVYVIPPGFYMELVEGRLRLISSEDSPAPRMPVDYFLRSLAKDRGGRSIGVILSGTASDGTIGLMSVKAEGGITFAQDEKTAKYDGMPRSAIAAGCVDFVQSPEGIAKELTRLSRHPSVLHGKPRLSEDALITQDSLERIFMLLSTSSGVDFSYYKPSTIRRRILRRMVLLKMEGTDNYVRYLQEHPAELNNLYQDILINVTSFFRDPESFDILKEKVFPAFVNGRKHDSPIRIWVPGCSTGEEPYSLAIALLEFMSGKAINAPVQIFATDIDDAALEKARAGRFPENIAADVSQERLKKYFVQTEKGYQISKQIRDLCVFAKHNIVKDPPFSRLDLVSCRNLLIYLGPVLQKKVFPIFHYALNPQGFLLLGTSETVGRFTELFNIIDKKQKVYSKKVISEPPHIQFSTEMEREPLRFEAPVRKEHARADLMREADRLILYRYAPPSVLINRNMEILKFSGRTGQFLEHAPGEASLNLFKMVNEGLVYELRKAVTSAMKEGVP